VHVIEALADEAADDERDDDRRPLNAHRYALAVCCFRPPIIASSHGMSSQPAMNATIT
jgi:hypothetical protein